MCVWLFPILINMDDSIEEIPTSVTVEGGPAYDMSAWHTGDNTGPQCSASGEFCFFCQFRDKGSEEIEFGQKDDCGALKHMVRALARQKKEMPVIINTVSRMYQKNIRDKVNVVHSITGVRLKAPDWSKTSIQRHLTYSLEFPELFDGVVSQAFQSIIVNQQNALIDQASQHVIEDRRRAFMDTVKTYSNWRLTQHRLYSTPTARKPRLKTIPTDT